MYNTCIRPLLVQARTADYALSRVVQVATQFLNGHMPGHRLVKSKSKLYYDQQSVRLGVRHPSGTRDQFFPFSL
jgi:hypothetical protein